MRTRSGPSTLTHLLVRIAAMLMACCALAWAAFQGSGVSAAIYKWQTLIAGVLAIAAAGVGGAFVYRQTKQADAHEQERRRGRLAAARAVLPLTLTSICQYSAHCGGQVKEVLDAWNDGQKFPRGYVLRFSPFPTLATEDLRLFIEAADEDSGEYASTLIVMIQIMSARLSDLSMDLILERQPRMLYKRETLGRLAADLAEIYVVSETFLSYARRTQDTPPTGRIFTEFNLVNALEAFNLDPTVHREAFGAAYDSEDGKDGLWRSLQQARLNGTMLNESRH